MGEGTTGFDRTIALSGVMSATFCFLIRLGWSATFTLFFDVACLSSGCVDLTVSS